MKGTSNDITGKGFPGALDASRVCPYPFTGNGRNP